MSFYNMLSNGERIMIPFDINLKISNGVALFFFLFPKFCLWKCIFHTLEINGEYKKMNIQKYEGNCMVFLPPSKILQFIGHQCFEEK